MREFDWRARFRRIVSLKSLQSLSSLLSLTRPPVMGDLSWLIARKFVVGVDHPFFADAKGGDGLAFGFVEDGGGVLFGALRPAGKRHDPTARQIGDALMERFNQEEREEASEPVRLAGRNVCVKYWVVVRVLALVLDDDGRIPQAQQLLVDEDTPKASVAVAEGVDDLEFGVEPGDAA